MDGVPSIAATLITNLLGLALATALTLAAAIPIRWIAFHFGILDRPSAHKTHRDPIPYLGGLAIWLGLVISVALIAPEQKRLPALVTVILLLGLVDDVFDAKVATKLGIEIGVAIAVIGLGFVWHVTDSYLLNVIISLVWIVGLTNAFNLLDNMDGLTSTVAIAGLLGMAFFAHGIAYFALPMAGALLGFLYWNRPPARMYMGDAGSLMVGFSLAVATIATANTAMGLHSLALLAGPVAVAVFDTSLVIVSRILAGLPIQVGGRDHFSHRLQSIGWSRTKVLGAAFFAATLGDAIALLAASYPHVEAWLAVPIAVSGAAAWVWLLRMNPYSSKIKVMEAVSA